MASHKLSSSDPSPAASPISRFEFPAGKTHLQLAVNVLGKVSEMSITSIVSSSHSTGVEERHRSLDSFSNEVAAPTAITEQGGHIHLLQQVDLSLRKVMSSEIPMRKTTGTDDAATTVACGPSLE